MHNNIKTTSMTILTKSEINSVCGGGFFKGVGKVAGKINREIDKGIKKVGEEWREAKENFQEGREEVRDKDHPANKEHPAEPKKNDL